MSFSRTLTSRRFAQNQVTSLRLVATSLGNVSSEAIVLLGHLCDCCLTGG